MQTITCDVCRKKMENPETGRTFFYYSEVGMCEPCRDEFDSQLRGVLRDNEPFTMEWYYNLVHDMCEKAVQKGKF